MTINLSQVHTERLEYVLLKSVVWCVFILVVFVLFCFLVFVVFGLLFVLVWFSPLLNVCSFRKKCNTQLSME